MSARLDRNALLQKLEQQHRIITAQDDLLQAMRQQISTYEKQISTYENYIVASDKQIAVLEEVAWPFVALAKVYQEAKAAAKKV